MGWSGALAGLGQGMIGYSQILGEKQKQDWLVQRDSVMFERNKELEALRNANNLKTAKEQQKMSDESWDNRFVQQNAAQIGAEGREQGRWEDRFLLQQAATDKAEDRRFGHEKDLLGMRQGAERSLAIFKNDLDIEKAESIADLAIKKDIEGKQKQLDSLMKSDMFNNASPELQEMLKLSTMHPEPFKLIAGTQKDSGMKKEMMQNYSIAYNKALESYDAVPEDKQRTWDKQAKAAGLQDGRFAFAEYSAAQATNLGALLDDDNSFFSSKVPKTSQKQPAQPKFDGEMASKIRQAYSSGDLSLKEIKEKTKGTPYESVYNDLLKSPRKESNEPGVLSSMASSAKQFATRNAPGSQQALNELKRKYPNMSDRFYQMKLEEMR